MHRVRQPGKKSANGSETAPGRTARTDRRVDPLDRAFSWKAESEKAERAGSQQTAAGKRPEAPENESAVSRDPGRERRRREAERRQRFAELRRPLEEILQRAERRIEALEEERDELLERLAGAADRNTDFGVINRRLAELVREIEEETAAWERAAEAIEALDRAKEAGLDPPDSAMPTQ